MNQDKDTEIRPWGFFEILFQNQERTIKKLVIKPNQKISLQSHGMRDEIWFIESGKAIVTLQKNEQVFLKGNYIIIPKGTVHRAWNFDDKKDLIILEIAYGTFNEEDITRYEDDYGRS